MFFFFPLYSDAASFVLSWRRISTQKEARIFNYKRQEFLVTLVSDTLFVLFFNMFLLAVFLKTYVELIHTIKNSGEKLAKIHSSFTVSVQTRLEEGTIIGVIVQLSCLSVGCSVPQNSVKETKHHSFCVTKVSRLTHCAYLNSTHPHAST